MTNKHNKAMEPNLMKQLESFGLNPSDWSLRPVCHKKYYIEHRSDREFIFIGEVKTENEALPEWHKIQLIGI